MPNESTGDPINHPILLVGLEELYVDALFARLYEEKIPTVVARDEIRGYTLIKSVPVSVVLLKRTALSKRGIGFLRIVHHIQPMTRRFVLVHEAESELATEEHYRGDLDCLLLEGQPVGEMAGAVRQATNSYCSESYLQNGLE